jgi:hypothetical protein
MQITSPGRGAIWRACSALTHHVQPDVAAAMSSPVVFATGPAVNVRRAVPALGGAAGLGSTARGPGSNGLPSVLELVALVAERELGRWGNASRSVSAIMVCRGAAASPGQGSSVSPVNTTALSVAVDPTATSRRRYGG